MYKLAPLNEHTKQQDLIIKLSDNAFIPFDPQNSNYIAYLKWIEEGNVPTPADEPQA
jgi:hypothetical protein